MGQKIDTILDNLLRPLAFASKDSFSHLDIVKDLEPVLNRLCKDILSLHPTREFKKEIHKLIEIAHGIDSLDSQSKRERILRAMEIVKSLKKSRVIRDSDLNISFNDAADKLEKLLTPVELIDSIGRRLAERLRKKGLEKVVDLLHFLPIRYEDRREIKKISQLRIGEREVFAGDILLLGEKLYGRRKVFVIVIGDGSGIIHLKWFNYNPRIMVQRFKKGERLIVFGEVRYFAYQKEVNHPDVEKVGKGGILDSPDFNTIVPVYSHIEGVHQRRFRSFMRDIIKRYAGYSLGLVPPGLQIKYKLLSLPDSIREVHFPKRMDGTGSRDWPPLRTLIFEELFSLELGLALKKRESGFEKGIAFNTNVRPVELLRSSLPFKLTSSQELVIDEIKRDMASPYQMNRLIQGDVGSGKTIVALVSCLIAIENGYQAAIMAPTEVLADQHYRTCRTLLKDLDIHMEILTSRVPRAERERVLGIIEKGKVDLIIGTHALIQEDVSFNNLGLIIIDEQHKFGVVQRATLKKKGLNPDVLVMTATPIPRTLAMTLFGDLDISIIRGLPPGRKPVITKVFREKDRDKVYRHIKKELVSGRQAYLVYPIIEESEELDLKDAKRMAEHLKKDVFPEYVVGLLHGRLRGEEKGSVMDGFKKGDIHILVTTTVVEVGIDAPNATIMVIEHAERFGLSQLHQLRGRVGRSDYDSYCFLMAYKIGSIDSYRRLKIMEETNDGFKIAEEDLKIRGPGDFIGTRQSGLPHLIHANLSDDSLILQRARDEAFRWVDNIFPSLKKDQKRVLIEVLNAKWKGKIQLARVG